MGYPFLKIFNLQVDTGNDRLIYGASAVLDAKVLNPSMDQPNSSVCATSGSSTAVSVPLSDHMLRRLLRCDGIADRDGDCCHSAKLHRLSTLGLPQPVDTDAVNEPLDADDSPTVDAPQGVQSLDDSWTSSPICRVDFDTTLSPEAKQALRHGSYEVIPSVFKWILSVTDTTPTLDVFASGKNAKLPTFFTSKDDAFRQDWSHDYLWICPQFSRLDAIIDKIVLDRAEGLILIPLWKSRAWFHALSHIAVKWWDLSQSEPSLQTPSGQPIPPKRDMQLRLVAFNAFDYLDPSRFDDTFVPSTSVRQMVPNSRTPNDFHYPHPLQRLSLIDWECPSEADLVQLRSVIASTSQHAQAQSWVDKILRMYHSELHEPKLARDVDPAVRGPFGMAVIELKDTARPLARKPFRLGERDNAL